MVSKFVGDYNEGFAWNKGRGASVFRQVITRALDASLLIIIPEKGKNRACLLTTTTNIAAALSSLIPTAVYQEQKPESIKPNI